MQSSLYWLCVCVCDREREGRVSVQHQMQPGNSLHVKLVLAATADSKNGEAEGEPKKASSGVFVQRTLLLFK